MSAKTKKYTCGKRIYDPKSWAGSGHLHGVTAKYEYEGQWYCKTHHPPTIAEKDNERDRERRAEWDAKTAARAKAAAIREAEQRVLRAASALDTEGARSESGDDLPYRPDVMEALSEELSKELADLKTLGKC